MKEWKFFLVSLLENYLKLFVFILLTCWGPSRSPPHCSCQSRLVDRKCPQSSNSQSQPRSRGCSRWSWASAAGSRFCTPSWCCHSWMSQPGNKISVVCSNDYFGFHLEFTGLSIHGEFVEIHWTHEPDSCRCNIQNFSLLWHPESLDQLLNVYFRLNFNLETYLKPVEHR